MKKDKLTRILTIHGEHNIEVSAIRKENSEEQFSHETVNGIVLYFAQARGSSTVVMSILLTPDNKVRLLANQGFSEKTEKRFLDAVVMLKDNLDTLDEIEKR